jgi:peptide/nickel transport system permease protein
MSPDDEGQTGYITALDAAEGIAIEPITQWDLFWTRLKRHRFAMISAWFLIAIVIIALISPLFTCPPGDDYQFCGKLLEHPSEQLENPETGRLFVNIAPRGDFPFGTDEIARDVLSRVVHGGRASLLVGGLTGLLVAALGTIFGSIAGYYPGAVDQSLMRFTDLVLGLPLLPVAIVVGRLLPELSFVPEWMRDGPWGIAFLLGFLLWGTLARIVRAEFLSLREKEFVEAARAAGARDRRIIFRHILPNAMSPIIVQTTLIVGIAIIIEAALSFLGFGVQPPTPTWGGMASAGAGVAVRGFWWELVFSAAALISTVLAVNYIGDGLRDALDPTQTIERK